MTERLKNTCDVEIIHPQIVKRVQEAMPKDHHFYNLSNLFKMFADNTRLKILWALSIEEMCVCDLSALLDMTISAVSHQLKALRQANLVKFTREGKNVFYSLVDCHVKEIFDMGLEHAQEGDVLHG